MSDESSVDRLKHKLYSRQDAPEVNPNERTPLSRPSPHIGRAWDGIKPDMADIPAPKAPEPAAEPKPIPPLLGSMSSSPDAVSHYAPPRKKSFAGWFLFGSVLFFVAAGGIAAVAFFFGGSAVSARNIDIEIVAPSLIDSGAQATLHYIITNRNVSALHNVDLIITYPSGTRSAVDTSQTLPRERQSLGDVASGAAVQQTSSAVFFGAQGEEKKVIVDVEYQVPGSNSIFTKTVEAAFIIGSAPVSLTITSPEEAIAGQSFAMDIAVKSNATEAVSDVMVEGRYPFGFTLSSSNPEAGAGGTVWRLGALKPGETKTIHLTGTLDGQEGDARVFHFLVGSEADQTAAHVSVPLLSVPQTLSVRRPFVSGVIAVEGISGRTIPVPLGKRLQGEVTWANNLNETVRNVTVTLTFTGDALNPTSVDTSSGFWNSNTSSITWTPQSNVELKELQPGASGTLRFSFAGISPSVGVLANPKLDLNVLVSATRTGQGEVPENISSAASAHVAFVSTASLTQEALHFTGPLTNTGPVPPVVGLPTTYTIVWNIKNSSNALSSGMVSAALPPYVEFVSAQTGGVSYDAPTRTVVWRAGEIGAGVGYTTAALAASFTVRLTPSLSQVNTDPQLIGSAAFTAQDRFAQATVTTSAPAVTTALFEAGFTLQMGQVLSQ